VAVGVDGSSSPQAATISAAAARGRRETSFMADAPCEGSSIRL
jgi:hypothetical protein